MKHLTITIIALLASLSAFADSGIWGARGIPRHFLVRDSLIYAVDGRGVTVYDVSIPSAIGEVALAPTDDESLDAALVGNDHLVLLTRSGLTLYRTGSDGSLTNDPSIALQGNFSILAARGNILAAARANSVSIWTLDSNGLESLGLIPLSGTLNAMAFHNQNLVMAVAGQGIFDVDLQGNQLSVLAGDARSLVVDGDTAYVAAGANGLLLVDLTDDSAIHVLGRAGEGSINFNHIAEADQRVFVTEGENVLHTYDVSVPASPKLLTTITDWVQTLTAQGPRLYVTGPIVDQFGLTHGSGIPLRIYDVSDSAAPKVAGDYHDLGGPVSGVATDGSVAYVVDFPYFRVIDVSTASNPRQLAAIQIPALQDRVKIQGNRAIVYGRGDVDLIDITNSYAPKLLGVFHSFGRPPSNAAFAGAGDTIVEGNPWSGFHVIDFNAAGPGQPGQIAGIKGHYTEIVGLGDYAYQFDQASNTRTIDLRVRGQALLVNEIVSPAIQAETVSSNDQHPALLLASLASGIRIFSLADPSRPEKIRDVPMSEGVLFGSSANTSYLATVPTLTLLNLITGGKTVTDMPVTAPMQVATANGKVVVADKYSLRIYGPQTAPPIEPVVEHPRRRVAAH